MNLIKELKKSVKSNFVFDESTWNSNQKTNSKIKNLKQGDKVFCKEPYAQDLYDLMTQTSSYSYALPKIDSVVRGNILFLTEKRTYIDAGFKDYIVCDHVVEGFKAGDEVDVIILEIQENPFVICGSINEITERKAQEDLEIAWEQSSAIEVFVKEYVGGGYIIQIPYSGIFVEAFMPNTLAGVNKISDPESLVGQSIEVGIEDYIKEKGTWILSRKKYLQSLIPQKIDDLEFNTLYHGNVTGSSEFGIFVEFDQCLTGMIHKTALNDETRARISSIRPGDSISFYVKEIIKGNKIILSQDLKQTLWDTIKPGQKIEGIVKNVKPFGILVSLDDETVGLIHDSELKKGSKEYKKGDTIETKVLAVTRTERKIWLGI